MRHASRFFVVSLSILALGGVGCWPSNDQSPTPAPTVTNTAPVATTPPSTNPSSGSNGSSALPVIDDTWVTYTSKSLGFSFKTPTKGTLAPTWEVSFVKADDSKVADGCYQGEQARGDSARLKVGETDFCHTGGLDPAAGNQYWTDYYLANIKNTWVLVTFSKHTTTGDNYENTACHGKYVVNGPSCSGFKTSAEYYAHLDQIMGTFVLGE